MAVIEIAGGFFAGASIVLVEYFRHRKTRTKMDAVISGVEHATRELLDKGGKEEAELVKMHIRSIAVKRGVEPALNINVKKIRAVIEALAEAAVEEEPSQDPSAG